MTVTWGHINYIFYAFICFIIKSTAAEIVGSNPTGDMDVCLL